MPALRLTIHGAVQGVGYRWWAIGVAERLGLQGWVRNRRHGTVEILAIGTADALESLAKSCEHGPPAARVTRIERHDAEDDGTTGFAQHGTF